MEHELDMPLPGTQGYQIFLRLMGSFLIALGGAIFFLPDFVYKALNLFPTSFQILQPLPAPIEHYWITTGAMLAILLGLNYLFASASPQVKGFPISLIVTHLGLAGGFTHQFMKGEAIFAHVAGMSLNVLAILLLLISMIKMGFKNRSARKLTPEPVIENTPGSTP